MRTGTKTLLTLIIGTTLGFALSVGTGVMAQRDEPRDSLPWDEARLLAEVLERVRQEYVEPVNDRDLIEGAVRGLVTELDPHSQFLDSEQYEEIRINTSGNYSGVGLEVNMDDSRVTVVTPIDDSPAAKAADAKICFGLWPDALSTPRLRYARNATPGSGAVGRKARHARGQHVVSVAEVG